MFRETVQFSSSVGRETELPTTARDSWQDPGTLPFLTSLVD